SESRKDSPSTDSRRSASTRSSSRMSSSDWSRSCWRSNTARAMRLTASSATVIVASTSRGSLSLSKSVFLQNQVATVAYGADQVLNARGRKLATQVVDVHLDSVRIRDVRTIDGALQVLLGEQPSLVLR